MKITGNQRLDVDWGVEGPSPTGNGTDDVAYTLRVLSAKHDPHANVTNVTYAIDGPPRGTFTESIPGDLHGQYVSVWAQTWSGRLFPDSPRDHAVAVGGESESVLVE